jgi:hypothetical protein
MKKLVIALLLSCSVSWAQESIKKNLGDFHTLKVFNGLQVELVRSSDSRIEIVGEQAEDVAVVNSNGILKVRFRIPDSFIPEDVRIVLFYNHDIAVLDANEGGKISSEKRINQQHLEVKVQEGAFIELDIKVKHLNVKSVTGGNIELVGEAENQTIEATTGGEYSAYNLKSKQANVTAASGARAEVQANEILDAKVRFGGTIHYIGNPEVLRTKKIIGGKIIDKN